MVIDGRDSFRQRTCNLDSDVNSVVAVPNGDRIEASELVIEDIAIALPRTTVLL
jgi:hypothetical protein